MTVLIKRLQFVVLAVIATVALPIVSRGEAPSGFVSFDFSTNDVAVYDLSGSLQFDQTMIGAGQSEIGLSYGINVTEDVRGFITGSGTTAVNAGDNFVAADYVARGRISRRGGFTRVSLTVRLRGNDAFGGITTPFNIVISYSLVVSPETGTLEGTARGRGSFGPLGSTRIHSDVSIPLPNGADGSWSLQMNLVSFNRLGGTATVVLSNGRVLSFNINGRFSSALDRSTVRLIGVGNSRGNNATLIFDSDVLLLRGALFGQTVFQ